MSVKIRLRRMGRKKQPHYRVVVADSASPRDGRFVESLGYYKPLTEPARLVVDLERVEYWISQGATPSDTVKSLLSKARKGGDGTLAVGEPDAEAEKARKAEALAVKRKAEKDAEEAAAAEAKAAADAEAKAAADAKAAAEAQAAAEAEPATEAAAEGSEGEPKEG
ncbi:MAG: 30S ribosomal protein S16 [Gemmatimonadales bacterium]|nr:MAG: 30S ribosomal protein S16 [Gemmatimonadales bacterium]